MLLRPTISLIRRWSWLLVLAMLLGSVAAYTWSRTQPVAYQATATLLVTPSDATQADANEALTSAERLARTYAELVKSGPVLADAAATLGLTDDLDVLARGVETRYIRESRFLNVTVEHANPATARNLANALAEAFVRHNADAQTMRFQLARANLKVQTDALAQRINETDRILEQLKDHRGAVVEQEKALADRERALQRLQDDIADQDREIEQRQRALDTFRAQSPAGMSSDAFVNEVVRLQTGVAEARRARDNQAIELNRLNQNIDRRSLRFRELLGRTTATGRPAQDLQYEVSRVTRELSNLRRSEEAFQIDLQELQAREARALNTLSISNLATLPAAPVKPRVLLNTVLAGVLSLLAALGIILARDQLDDRLSSPERLIGKTTLQPLAVIGKHPAGVSLLMRENPPVPAHAVVHLRDPKSYVPKAAQATEAYRTLRTNLRFGDGKRDARTILITSAEPTEGKTTTAANLALALAHTGFKTILVDGDLRRPGVHSIFGINPGPGLTELLADGGNVASYLLQSPVANLRILPAGGTRADAAELLGSTMMAHQLELLKAMTDYLVIDSSPVLAVSDPLALASLADSVVVVVNARTAHARAVRHALVLLDGVGAHVAGAVLNRYDRRPDAYYDRPELAPAVADRPIRSSGVQAANA